MCGLAGAYRTSGPAYEDQAARLTAALRELRRRGPDGEGVFADARAALAHARLSIFDPGAASGQPFADPAGRFRLVFNGAIFNYRVLREELRRQGVDFRTESDTEVLLEMLIACGAEALPRLNGFFAFAFYDAVAETLLLARDRYGMKPLYLAERESELLFGSTLGALRALGLPAELDELSLALYLQLNYLPPHRSMLRGVAPLAPGTWLRHGPGKRETGRYYDLPPACPAEPYDPRRLPELARQYAGLMDAAVERRLAADAPLGVFLSGGLDSTVVAGLAARHKQPLRTFSLQFNDALFDETPHAQAAARRLDAEHTVLRADLELLADRAADWLDLLDEPLGDAAALNLYVLSALARPQVKAALTGDGADELLGGYGLHYAEARSRQGGPVGRLLQAAAPLLRALPAERNTRAGRKLAQIVRYAEGAALPEDRRYWRWRCPLAPARALELLRRPPAAAELAAATEPWIRQLGPGSNMNDVLRADMQLVLGGDMAPKSDRAGMAAGLELRSPFLDHEAVDFAMRLAPEYKIRGKARKRLLLAAFPDLLPPEQTSRPKQGFEVPLRALLVGPLRPLVEQRLLDSERMAAQGLFRPEKVAQLWRLTTAGRNTKEDWTLWGLLVFQSWRARHFD